MVTLNCEEASKLQSFDRFRKLDGTAQDALSSIDVDVLLLRNFDTLTGAANWNSSRCVVVNRC